MINTERHKERALNSIKRTEERLDIGKTTIFKLINEGKLEVVKIGGKTLITESSIRRLATPPDAALTEVAA